MKTILRLVLLLGVVLLITSGIVTAQKPASTFCGELSKTDCTFLTDAEAAVKNVDSNSFKLDVTIDVSGIPNLPADKMTFHLTGSGAVVVDRKGMPDASTFDPTTFSKDPKAVFDLLGKAVSHVSADLQFVFELSKELKTMLGDSKLPDSLKLNVKLVDGVFYVNTAELAAFMPQAKTMPAWMGMSLPDLMTAIVKQPSFGKDMNSMSTGMSAGMSSSMITLFDDPKTLATFIHVKRLADSTVESQKVAVFETTLDYPAMFAMPEMQKMMTNIVTQSGTKMSDSEMKTVMGIIQGMAKGMQFTMTRSFDLEKKYTLQTDASFTMDMSSMKKQMGSAMVFGLKFSVTQSDFNAVPAITAPKGAVVVPASSVIPSK